jgi:hypothetical protein
MRKVYITLMAVMLFIIAPGCKKYLDINSNPVTPQIVKAELLLPPMEFQMHDDIWQDQSRTISKVTQNFAGVSTVDAALLWERHGYTYNSDAGGVAWRMAYFDMGLNLENMINDAVANQKNEYAGIGYAIKAWTYQITTDQYGPIILDDAFKNNTLTFKFQDQDEVYPKVREWCFQALKYMNTPSPISYTATLQGASGDGIYKGDMTKWKKFVYAVLATQYGHLVNKTDFKTKYADSVIKYVDLSFANETEDPTVFFQAAGTADVNLAGPTNAGSSTSGVLNVSTYYCRQTSTILGLLTGGVRGTPAVGPTTSLDPRLSRYLTPGTSTGGTGNPTGTTYIAVQPTKGSTQTTVPNILGSLPTGSTLFNGRYIFTDRARWPIMTYAQMQFIKSEAAFIKGDVNTAYTAYINGIKASMDFYNQYGRTQSIPDPAILASDVTTYLASSEVAQTAGTLTIADIMQQKYIAQWGWGSIETWCDLRKYHYNPAVFRTYFQLTGTDLQYLKYKYRCRPRFNSEFVWNAAELTKFGGNLATYETQDVWFNQP